MAIETTEKNVSAAATTNSDAVHLSQQVFGKPPESLGASKATAAESFSSSTVQPKAEVTSILAKAGSEAVDFGEGLYYGAIESPIDGAIQLTNHVAGTKLPELHLVDEQKLSQSIGGVLGNVAGTALDIYALSAATGGIGGALGGSSMIASALRFSAVGAAYTAALQPTDDNSKTFIKDRLTNGAIALGTFAAMGGAATALDATGIYAVSAARSLTGSLTYGAIAGAAGGVVNAEGNAVLKEGKILPSAGELAKDTATYAAFGMAFAGAGYAVNRLRAPAPQSFNTDNGDKMTVTTDSQGRPISLQGYKPNEDGVSALGYQSTKMTTGNWSSKGWEVFSGDKVDELSPPPIDDVQINGNKLTVTGGGLVNQYTDGGTYTSTNPKADAFVAQQDADYAKHNTSTKVNGVVTSRSYDEQMRLTSINTPGAKGADSYGKSAYIQYDHSGAINEVAVSQGGKPEISLTKLQDNSWSVDTNNNNYKWNGVVKLLPAAGPDAAEQIQFTPKGGSAASTFNLNDGVKPVADMIKATAPYVPGGTGRPILKVDENGQTTLTGGTSSAQKAIVNGIELANGQTSAVNPGDRVQMKVDVGDSYTVYQLRDVNYGRNADGTQILGTTKLKPNTAIDFDATVGGTKLAKVPVK
jgi:hypothetical protein